MAPSADQKSTELPPTVIQPDRNAKPKQRGRPTVAAERQAASSSAAGETASSSPTPLNSNVIATSASRLGLTVHETPATVEVVSRSQMQEQGYRTTTETAQGAVGV
jgi:iron complex outermembrane receptor protein